jgi:hypothetical protein
MPTKKLPEVQGYTFDERLGEFRKYVLGLIPEHIPIESPKGQELLKEMAFMTTEKEYTLIIGQCGTCAFAQDLSMTDPPDGHHNTVQCVSEAHAKYLDNRRNPQDSTDETFNQNQKELELYGFMQLIRIEALAETSFHCPSWEPSDLWRVRNLSRQNK